MQNQRPLNSFISTFDWKKDIVSGFVVFLVALPLCLGVSLASGAPLISGILSGVVGGLLVGALSGSHTSVSGPGPGLIAVIAAQLAILGDYSSFLVAVALAGLFQIALGYFKAGMLASFVPSSVIKGLLAAIGIILILKHIPHLVGLDTDPEGDYAFFQIDRENTFSEIAQVMLGSIRPGPTLVGGLCLLLLLAWDKLKFLKQLGVPAALPVVGIGTLVAYLGNYYGGWFVVEGNHRVAVPVASSLLGFFDFLQFPNWQALGEPRIYLAALTIALVASLETLLNLNAVDKIDPRRRVSPPNRELLAQGVGNTFTALLGGLPLTSVIVRSSVNVNSGAASKWSAMFHGLFLLLSVAVLPNVLNLIPIAALAAILFVTGLKLASPKIFADMWRGGKMQFIPFLITVLAIVFTDLLVGVLLGLGVSMAFILMNNAGRPLKRVVEQHVSGQVHRIELATQVSFLNKAALSQTFNRLPEGAHVLIDASQTTFMDSDIAYLIREFKEETAPVRRITVSLLGFKNMAL